MSASLMHIACTADESYVPHCATMLASLLDRHDAGGICVHYLHPEDFSPPIRERLEEFVRAHGAEIRFHAFADSSVADLPSWTSMRPVMWYRVMLPERLPELDRILYIDADTIVLDDLRPLWTMDLNDAYLAAVTNVSPPMFADHPLELGLPDRKSYFNSGVMLLNLARMRAEDSTRSLIEYSRHQQMRWWDQDGLNIFFHRERLSLHPRWNCTNGVFMIPDARAVFGLQSVDEAQRNPAIVHFEGPAPIKPWHFLSKHPYKAQYLEYRATTPWPLPELEGRTLHNRLLRLLPANGMLHVVGFEYRVGLSLRALQRKVVARMRRMTRSRR
jgi:lipopolysaccharide biosynthesis glycosyltransferase